MISLARIRWCSSIKWNRARYRSIVVCCMTWMLLFGTRSDRILSTRKSRIRIRAYPSQLLQKVGNITLVLRSSNCGLTSSTALMPRFSSSCNGANFESNSTNALTHASLISPSDIRCIIAGDRIISSTIGPRLFSTCFLFAALVERDIDRAWRNSISADTDPRSV